MKEIPNLLKEASLSSEVREEKFAVSVDQFIERFCGFLDQHGQEVFGRKVWEKALSLDSGVTRVKMESLLNRQGGHAGLYVLKIWESPQPANTKFFGSLMISERDRGHHQVWEHFSHPDCPWQGVEIKSNIGLRPWWDVLNYITKT